MQQKSDPRVTERESYATSSTETAGSPLETSVSNPRPSEQEAASPASSRARSIPAVDDSFGVKIPSISLP